MRVRDEGFRRLQGSQQRSTTSFRVLVSVSAHHISADSQLGPTNGWGGTAGSTHSIVPVWPVLSRFPRSISSLVPKSDIMALGLGRSVISLDVRIHLDSMRCPLPLT